MRAFFIKHWLKIAGIAAGALVGYLYYYYVGCVSGTCPITSNPYKMMLYGALIGYLFFDMFSPKKGPKKVIETTEQNENKQNNQS